MKRILLFCTSLILILIINQASALVVFEKKKTTILDYSKNEKLIDTISSWDVKVFLFGDSWLKVVNDKDRKKLYIEIVSANYVESGVIYVKVKGKINAIDYQVNLKEKKEVFDISSDLLFKRIQSRPLSCESSAAADIISYFNDKNVDEFEVYDAMARDMDFISTKSADNIFWWDPNKWFVWHIDYYWDIKNIKPYQSKYTWYGVYEKPVAEVFEKYGLETQIINNKDYDESFWEEEHLKFILNSLKSGKMVQLWWVRCTDPRYEDGIYKSSDFTQNDASNYKTAKNSCATFSNNRTLTWFYRENWKLRIHKGLSWEHAFYLLWYEGNVNNPEKIIVWDTDTGYHKYDTVEWMRKWRRMDYRSIIISKVDPKLVYIERNKKLTNYFNKTK